VAFNTVNVGLAAFGAELNAPACCCPTGILGCKGGWIGVITRSDVCVINGGKVAGIESLFWRSLSIEES
jgi:hypothetical protein